MESNPLAKLKLVVHGIKRLGEVNIGIAHEDMNHGHGNNPLGHQVRHVGGV
jgi:hypothetical protein